MTVAVQTPFASYTSSGSVTFAYAFKVNSASDLIVKVNGVTQNSALYSVTGVGSSAGSVVFISAPSVGAIVTIQRKALLQRTTDYQINGDLLASTVNPDFDALWMALQDTQYLQNYALQISPADIVGVNTTLPTPVGGTVIGWDALGKNLVNFVLQAGTSLVNLAASAGSSLIGFIQSGTGAVARTVQDKGRDIVSVSDFGIISDGATDQTSALVSYFSANSSYRGTVAIPYNTKFTKSTVYAAVPVGMILIDDSSINTGQPPSYKNKVRRTYTNDTTADDASTEIASSHHPALRLNNLGTAVDTSATSSYHSVLRSRGFRWTGDPIDGMQWLTNKSARGNLWRTADILNTPYDYATNYTTHWSALTVFAAGAKINTTDGQCWSTVAGGTSASTEPTGTGPSFSDGTVTWVYQGAWSAGSTRFYYDEDGYGAINGVSTARWGAETNSSSGISINVNSTTGDTYLRDDQRAQDLVRMSNAKGLQLGGIQSLGYSGDISGATPTITGSFHSVNNGSAVNMTGMNITGSQNSAIVWLYFKNGNTTLKNAGSQFTLKGGVDVTPVAGQIMCFLRENTLSAASWYEVSRSF